MISSQDVLNNTNRLSRNHHTFKLVRKDTHWEFIRRMWKLSVLKFFFLYIFLNSWLYMKIQSFLSWRMH